MERGRKIDVNQPGGGRKGTAKQSRVVTRDWRVVTGGWRVVTRGRRVLAKGPQQQPHLPHDSPVPGNLLLSNTMDDDLHIVVCPDFEFQRRSRDGAGWRGMAWTDQRVFDQNVKPSRAAIEAARAMLHANCPEEVVYAVTKGWQYAERDTTFAIHFLFSACSLTPLCIPRKTTVFVTKSGQIIALIASQEALAMLREDAEAVHEGLRDLENKLKDTKKYETHNRGSHPCLNVGVGFGGGDKVSQKKCSPTLF